ncbi:MAG: hypothetical protein IJR13_05110 [Bacteroidales bacterium]|nr:hypothetical protein [Bacteroidales bacterium]
MKRLITLAIILSSIITLASCKKNCRCYGYDGNARDYSRQEVNDRGGSCPNMIYQANTRFYSICEWDN